MYYTIWYAISSSAQSTKYRFLDGDNLLIRHFHFNSFLDLYRHLLAPSLLGKKSSCTRDCKMHTIALCPLALTSKHHAPCTEYTFPPRAYVCMHAQHLHDPVNDALDLNLTLHDFLHSLLNLNLQAYERTSNKWKRARH